MIHLPPRMALGLCLAALISISATASGALTARAALTSTTVGTIVFVAGGVAWSIPLLTFFVTSSILSRRRGGTTPTRSRIETPRRSTRQVLANGLIPSVWAACHYVFPADTWSVLFASALATAAADTWATEIGRRSSTVPRDLLTGRTVRAGTSGGVTLTGLAASLGGSATVTAACLVMGVIGPPAAAAVAVAGFGGALADSLLGAGLQEHRWCPTCFEETEEEPHARCSAATLYLRGIRGFDNDWVNLSAGAIGSALGLVLTHLL